MLFRSWGRFASHARRSCPRLLEAFRREANAQIAIAVIGVTVAIAAVEAEATTVAGDNDVPKQAYSKVELMSIPIEEELSVILLPG